ncbi:MAG: sulfurtransferase, partial [Actinomycetota bacterium]
PKRTGDAARTTLDISGWLRQSSTFVYDADGRMLTQSVFRRDETTQTITRHTLRGFETLDTGVKDWVAAAYREMQRHPDAAWQVVRRYQLQTETLSEVTLTSFEGAEPTAARYNWRGRLIEAATPRLGYDAAGNLLGYTVQERRGGTVRWTDTYSYAYSLQDGYLETKVTGSSSDRNRRASETLSGYDGWGRRTSLEERTSLRDFKQTLRSARYFAYDADGGLMSAARVWLMLRWMGHDRVAVLDGGWQAWVDSGSPIEPDRDGLAVPPGQTDVPIPTPATFTARVRPDLLAEVVEVDIARQRPLTCVFDSRGEEGYHGRGVYHDPVRGHIARAGLADRAHTLTPDKHFRPPDELRAHYDSLIGDQAPDDIIFYCGSGITAAQNVLAMTIAGLPGSRMYVGSWSEWINDPRRPTEL